MSIKISKAKTPRIVEYISPERKEILDRIRKINDKSKFEVTKDDIEFLRANGLDWNGRNITKDGEYFAVPHEFLYGDKFDFLDASEKHKERGTNIDYRGEVNNNRPEPVSGFNKANRNSPELARTAQELRDAKRWGTDRQVKVWQSKYDREKARLKAARSDAENRKWRDGQNDEMRKPLDQLRIINRRLNPDKQDSYDAAIRYVERRKAEREAELLKRYEDELARYQARIDDIKQAKKDAEAQKARILRRPVVEVDEDEVEEIEESVNVCPKCGKNPCVCESCKESVGEDVSEYQKWVDYDMKKYHRISKDTMDKIKSAGLSVVKDQYGDYEVIADRHIEESREEMRELRRDRDKTRRLRREIRRDKRHLRDEDDYIAGDKRRYEDNPDDEI